MDTDKLYKELVNKEDIQDIPIETICRVAICVIEIINSGECFKENQLWDM